MSKNKDSYGNYFPEVFIRILERRDRKIGSLKTNGLPKNAASFYDGLLNDFKDAAIGEIIINSDVIKSKQNFFLAAKIQEILFQKYNANQDSIPYDYVNADTYTRLFISLICDNNEQIVSLARLYGGRPKEEKDDYLFYLLIGYSTKYLILNDFPKAKEYIEKLKSMETKKDLKMYTGYGIVLKGIFDKDQNSVNDGLKFMIECHKKLKDFDETPEELLSIAVLGLAKLAIRHGIKLDIDDVVAPKIIIERQQIEYPKEGFI
jgi:hypothetical protein